MLYLESLLLYNNTYSSSMNIGILGIIILANPAKQPPNITNGNTDIIHSFKQFGNIAKNIWVIKNINEALSIYTALGLFLLNDIYIPTKGVNIQAAKYGTTRISPASILENPNRY